MNAVENPRAIMVRMQGEIRDELHRVNINQFTTSRKRSGEDGEYVFAIAHHANRMTGRG